MTGLIPILIIFVLVWFGAGYFLRKQHTQTLRQQCQKQGFLCLTYDDGPSEKLTSDLLKILMEANAKASFFVLGGFAEKHPEVLANVRKGGHQIGSHTLDHTNAWKTSPWRHAKDRTAGANMLLKSGIQATAFRPPFGKLTLGGVLQSTVRKETLAFWTIDSQDSWNRRPIEDVLADVREQNGGVVLMHDRQVALRGPEPEKHAEYVKELTSALLSLAEKNGLKVVRMDEVS